MKPGIHKAECIKTLIAGIMIMSFTSSCASNPVQYGIAGTIAGAGIGAPVGLTACPGQDDKYYLRNVLIGAGSGALLGLISSQILYHYVKAKEKEAFERGNQRALLESVDPNAALSPTDEWKPSVIYSEPPEINR